MARRGRRPPSRRPETCPTVRRQAQRVAIARALAVEPRLLPLDEPLAALDVGAAPLLRRVLRRVLADRSAIIVTHDHLDAVLLSHKILMIDEGQIVESGPTEDVIRHPRAPAIEPSLVNAGDREGTLSV